jgi:hypothetical protein
VPAGRCRRRASRVLPDGCVVLTVVVVAGRDATESGAGCDRVAGPFRPRPLPPLSRRFARQVRF